MRHRCRRSTFGCAVASVPVADAGDLLEALDRKYLMEDRVVERQFDDRKGRRRQRLAQLVLPHIPGVLAPEIVGPQKPAAQQIVLQVGGLQLVKVGATRLGHHDERAV
jgi:hypothetical protein